MTAKNVSRMSKLAVKRQVDEEISKWIKHNQNVVNKSIVAAPMSDKRLELTDNRFAALKKTCPDADECMVFGLKTHDINAFYDNFNPMSFLHGDMKRISEGSNGKVYKLTYRRKGYDAHAILKVTTKLGADNQWYEAIVSKSIDRMNIALPCFIQYYGFVRLTNTAAYNKIFKNSVVASKLLKDNVEMTPIDITAPSCGNDRILNASIIQMIPQAKTFGSVLQTHLNHSAFTEIVVAKSTYWFMSTIAQVYLALALIVKDFTHYDLHDANVLMHKPFSNDNDYYEYHYHDVSRNTTTSFCAQYIVKIIDYGRCFVSDEIAAAAHTLSSKQSFAKICKEKTCIDCGKNQGFTSMLSKADAKKYFSYITSLHPNASHDLRLIANVRSLFLKMPFLQSELPIIWDMLARVQYDDRYGTHEIPPSHDSIDSRTTELPPKINNVVDAANFIRLFFNDPKADDMRDRAFDNKHKRADMHVYSDMRPMTFTVV